MQRQNFIPRGCLSSTSSQQLSLGATIQVQSFQPLSVWLDKYRLSNPLSSAPTPGGSRMRDFPARSKSSTALGSPSRPWALPGQKPFWVTPLLRTGC